MSKAILPLWDEESRQFINEKLVDIILGKQSFIN
ncbi:hypothetical protein LYNGBM3L_25370 [Moorena producens 3L]|uniref:Uncharacterized protein n=1 Tax=Moorena producens 3L TaxID=489825 RepID=F4XNV0_9CYAN|nr:hypothetical protein LYNGBM3L_25370 [Moorena producens 3L]